MRTGATGRLSCVRRAERVEQLNTGLSQDKKQRCAGGEAAQVASVGNAVLIENQHVRYLPAGTYLENPVGADVAGRADERNRRPRIEGNSKRAGRRP